MKDAILKAYLDRDGALAIPEIIATIGALGGIGATLFDWCFRGGHPDLQSFGLGLGSIVAGLAGAQRIRDGITRDGDEK